MDSLNKNNSNSNLPSKEGDKNNDSLSLPEKPDLSSKPWRELIHSLEDLDKLTDKEIHQLRISGSARKRISALKPKTYIEAKRIILRESFLRKEKLDSNPRKENPKDRHFSAVTQLKNKRLEYEKKMKLEGTSSTNNYQEKPKSEVPQADKPKENPRSQVVDKTAEKPKSAEITQATKPEDRFSRPLRPDKRPYGSSSNWPEKRYNSSGNRPEKRYRSPAYSPEKRYGSLAYSSEKRYSSLAYSSEKRYSPPANKPEKRYSSPANWPERTYSSTANWPEKTYSSPAKWLGKTNSSPANWPEKTTCSSPADWPEKTYSSPANWLGKTYSSTASWPEKTTYSSPANWPGKTYSSSANWAEKTYSSPANWQEKTYSSPADRPEKKLSSPDDRSETKPRKLHPYWTSDSPFSPAVSSEKINPQSARPEVSSYSQWPVLSEGRPSYTLPATTPEASSSYNLPAVMSNDGIFNPMSMWSADKLYSMQTVMQGGSYFNPASMWSQGSLYSMQSINPNERLFSQQPDKPTEISYCQPAVISAETSTVMSAGTSTVISAETSTVMSAETSTVMPEKIHCSPQAVKSKERVSSQSAASTEESSSPQIVKPAKRRCQSPPSVGPEKRQRQSVQTVSAKKKSKPAKSTPTLKPRVRVRTKRQSKPNESEESEKVAIVLEGFPEAQMEREKQEIVIQAILTAYENLKRPVEKRIGFDRWISSTGYVLIICMDNYSAQWLKQIVPSLKPWENCCLKALSADELPKPCVCTVFVPEEFGEKLSVDRILARLRVGNDGLNTDLWKVWGRSLMVEKGQVWSFTVDIASLNKLKKIDMSPRFGFTKLKFRCKTTPWSGSHDVASSSSYEIQDMDLSN